MSDSPEQGPPRARPRRYGAPPEDPADVRVDPLADYPTFDPASVTNPPLPGRTSLTVPDDDITALSCREKLRQYARELLTASPARLKALAPEIQRTRLAEKLLTEADEGTSDPDTYKELAMLNRMLAGDDELDDPTGDVAAQAEAEALLAARRIDPDKARRLLRALEALNAAPEDDARGPGPEGPPAIERGRRRTTH